MRRSGRRSTAGKASARVTFFWSCLFGERNGHVDAGSPGGIHSLGIAPAFAHFDKFLVVGCRSRNGRVAFEVGRLARQHHCSMGRNASLP